MLNPRIKQAMNRNLPQIILATLVVLFMIIYLAPATFIIIRPGEAGVLYKRFNGGTVTDQVFGEGLRIIFPWDKMYIYDMRIQNVPHELDVLTEHGLRITLSLSIRFRPEYDLVGVLHKEVGPAYINKFVVPEVESAIRTRIGAMGAADVYMNKNGILDKIISESIEQLAYRFVKIDDVIIRKITLPQRLQKAIEEKLEQEQLAAAYEYRIAREHQEAERKQIEAGGYNAYNRIVDSSLTDRVLRWKGIEATRELAVSNNTKVIVVGTGKEGLPIILGADK